MPRTLVDLAAILPEDELARAVHEAQVKYRTKPDQIEAILPPKAKGAGTLRRILRGDTHLVLSKLEKAFLELLTKHHLPLPETNKQSGSFFVDCRWPKKMLTIELDGYRYHASRHAWQQDRNREREARARGDRFRRYSWDDVTKHPATTAAELQELLA